MLEILLATDPLLLGIIFLVMVLLIVYAIDTAAKQGGSGIVGSMVGNHTRKNEQVEKVIKTPTFKADPQMLGKIDWSGYDECTGYVAKIRYIQDNYPSEVCGKQRKPSRKVAHAIYEAYEDYRDQTA